MKRAITILSVCAAVVLLVAGPASASTISIHISGLDAVYDGFDLYDAGSPVGGIQDPNDSDPLTSVSFFSDGVLVGTLVSDVFADFAIVNPGNIPVGGGTVTSSFGGFFDLLTSSSGWGIGLDFNTFSLTYSGGQIRGAGVATGILGQALPFGLTMTAPVALSFTLDNLTNVTNNGTRLTGFEGSGTADLVALPEPSTLLLFGTGVALLRTRARKRGALKDARGSLSN